jgi:hypothetical protein
MVVPALDFNWNADFDDDYDSLVFLSFKFQGNLLTLFKSCKKMVRVDI